MPASIASTSSPEGARAMSIPDTSPTKLGCSRRMRIAMARLLLNRAFYARPSPLPADPVANGTAHDELEITPAEPRQLFGEQRHALTPRAGHARDVGAPEPARGAERVVEPMQVAVDIAERVRLIGVARRARGLHGDVGIFRERQHLREICPPLWQGRGSTGPAEMIEDQLEVRMPLRHLGNLRKEPRGHQCDGQARPLRRRPEPIDGPVRQPRALRWFIEREPQAEHPGSLLPRIHEPATLWLVEREAPE